MQVLVEELKEKCPLALTDLILTIPVLPGYTYAEVFFIWDISNTLKKKINILEIKEHLEQLVEDEEGVTKFLVAHRDKFELIYLLLEGNLFSSNSTKQFPYNLED